MAAALLQIDLVFSRPQTTLAVTRGAARLMVDLGYAPLLEVGLPNGRRADVMALGPRGDIVIVRGQGRASRTIASTANGASTAPSATPSISRSRPSFRTIFFPRLRG